MSFYTGPNELDLIPLRFAVSPQSARLAELEEFARGDIRKIASRTPQLKSAILSAYRDAPPEGGRLIEADLGELDPDLLKAIRGIADFGIACQINGRFDRAQARYWFGR